MNPNLITAIKSLVAARGAGVLSDAARVNDALPVFANKEAAAERNVFVQCISYGVARELQKLPDAGARLELKKRLAKNIINAYHLPVDVVKESFDIIEEALYGAVTNSHGTMNKYGLRPPAAMGMATASPSISQSVLPQRRGAFFRRILRQRKMRLAAVCAGVVLAAGVLFYIQKSKSINPPPAAPDTTLRENQFAKNPNPSVNDPLADILQDLAMQTACLGRYSNAETGDIVRSRYDDPPDWYDPPMLAERFAKMSGDKTRIDTFYGVCFNYAEFAWADIKKYQNDYNDAGMKEQQWYIAADGDDDHTVVLFDPVPFDNATTKVNGVYVKENSRQNVRPHDGAAGHAWLWVQHKNGTWYWIDPTWTDNTGYVWWGKVENGREVMYYPDGAYCVNPDYPK